MIWIETFFSWPFVRFWERHYLNLIQVWEFPEYLRLSLPSGLRCVMSYLMQPDKQYACTDSIKETEWGTHTGELYVHLHTSTHTNFYILAGYITHSAHSTALFGQKPSTPTHTCSATRLSMQRTKKSLHKHLFSAKAPLDVLRAVWWHAPFGLITRFAKLWPQSPFPTLK